MAALALLLVVATGCGGGDQATTTSGSPTGTSGGSSGSTAPGSTAPGGQTTTSRAPVIKTGAELYPVFCAGCHGSDGKARFSPAIAGLDKATVEKVITEGKGDMKAFGGILAPVEITSIAEYVTGMK